MTSETAEIINLTVKIKLKLDIKFHICDSCTGTQKRFQGKYYKKIIIFSLY